MKKIVLTESGGFPMEQYTLNKMQQSYFEIFYSMFNFLGINETVGKYIIKGCEVSAGMITPGWMFIDGELVKFDGAAGDNTTKFEKMVTAETVAFYNGQNKPVYITSAVQITTTGTPLSEFTRITQIVPLPEGIVVDPNYAQVLQRITLLESKTAIFQAGGVVFPWFLPISQIPIGFAEVTDLRGKTIFGMNIEIDPLTETYIDPEFRPLTLGGDDPGRTGGSKTQTLVEDNMPDHFHKMFSTGTQDGTVNGSRLSNYPDYSVAQEGNWDGNGGISDEEYIMAADSGTNEPTLGRTSKYGKNSEEITPVNILPPYTTAVFIEWVGLPE